MYNLNAGYGQITGSFPLSGTGKVFFVGASTVANINIMQQIMVPDQDGTLRIFSDIDSAIGATTAAAGDVIFVLPGHTETLATASAIALDVVGVSVIGLGSGSNRPVLTFSATTATIAISAASTTFSNIVVVSGVNNVAAGIVISAADVTLNVETRDTSAILEFISPIVTTAAADRLTINWKHIGFLAGAVGTRGIDLVGANTANITVDYFGVSSVAVVNMRTTASDNVTITGNFRNGTTSLTKDVIDTVGTSTWTVTGFDGVGGANFSGGSGAAVAYDDASAIAAQLNVPTADASTNTNERDVIGNKTDAAVYVPGTTNSLAAYAKGTANLQERVALKAAATITNGQTLFTIAGGPIQIIGLVSICVTGNDGTASTLQYNVTPTSGSAQTISGASASLASALAGASVTLAGTALATAALLNANGANLIANPGTILAPAGVLTAVVGVGSTTGTWAHYLRYRPLAVGVTVV